MSIDPTRWLVSFAGFLYDWIITREWTRIAIALVPVALLTTVISLVWWGQIRDRRELAGWYMELGDQQIAEWEESLISEKAGLELKSPDQVSEDGPQDEDDADDSDANRVSRYADMLFRRVQVLAPSDRSQYIIGVHMAQGGAWGQGEELLSQIAPHDRSGYPPAHGFLALMYLDQFRKSPSPAAAKLLMHHIREAKNAERVPLVLLRAGSDLFWVSGKPSEAIKLLARAAESDPQYNLELSKRARAARNQRVLEQSVNLGVQHFTSALAKDARDADARVSLADIYVGEGRLDDAEKLLRDGQELEPSPILIRGLSEVYRFRYLRSLKSENGTTTADVQLLDRAMRYDPTNPMVVQEIAKLARLQGPRANRAMIDKLQQFLAEGKATAATHAWLAESYLIRENYAKALPHLEQVVTRLPGASQYLNNLAFVLAELHPDRLEEALGYAQRAIATAAQAETPRAEYYDTLGKVLALLGRTKEAITALETAVEMNPLRIAFHENVAVQYEKLGNQLMADSHRSVIKKIEAEQAAAAAANPAGQTDPSSTGGLSSGDDPAVESDPEVGSGPTGDSNPAGESETTADEPGLSQR